MYTLEPGDLRPAADIDWHPVHNHQPNEQERIDMIVRFPSSFDRNFDRNIDRNIDRAFEQLTSTFFDSRRSSTPTVDGTWKDDSRVGGACCRSRRIFLQRPRLNLCEE